MNIEQIYWHDSVLRKVVEIPALGKLFFEVDYPVDWENNEFSPHTIKFAEVCSYEIHEGPFQGALTILDASSSEADQFGTRTIRVETNAGFRIVRCKSIVLEPGAIPG